MKITILCSANNHPVNSALEKWVDKRSGEHEILLTQRKNKLTGGDILFLISCNEIIPKQYRSKFTKTLIIHASDLPKGRGWSPHIWSILKGADTLIISLFEADDRVDRGDIWKKIKVNIPKHTLYDEINEILFKAETELMDFALESFSDVKPEPQDNSIESSYCRRRTPDDSELDANVALASQFNLLRVCDPDRFPAYFRFNDHCYKITIEKIEEEKTNY